MVEDIAVWDLIERADPVEQAGREVWGTLSGEGECWLV